MAVAMEGTDVGIIGLVLEEAGKGGGGDCGYQGGVLGHEGYDHGGSGWVSKWVGQWVARVGKAGWGNY